MSVDNAILFTFITILLSLNIGKTSGECISDTSCSCVMSNGEGYDLSKITGSKDEFIESAIDSNRKFYFHPCHDKILTNKTINGKPINTTDCESKPGVTLCLYDTAANRTTNLGTVGNSRLMIRSNGAPQLIIQHASNNKNTTVTIDLICNPTEDTPPILADYDIGTSEIRRLLLVSPYACKVPMHVGGLSTGSVLVIILFVFGGIYFVGGALVLKLLRGATGWEMLPNQTFWFDLPALVRDGIAFTFNGCKVVSYDQI